MYSMNSVVGRRGGLKQLLVVAGTCLALLASITIAAVIPAVPSAAAQSSAGDTIMSPDPGFDAGTSPSLALTADDRPIVAYRGLTAPGLRILVCDDEACDPTISITGANLDLVSNVDAASGIESVVAMNGALPVVLYENFTTGELKTYTCGDFDCTTGLSTAQTSDQVNTSSLDVAVASTGLPVLVYSGGAVTLRRCADAQCVSAASTVIEAGSFMEASVELDINNVPIVSYWDATTFEVKVAHCGDITCSSPTIETVDTALAGTTGVFAMDFELNGSGFPVLAYGSGVDLRVTTCGNATCSTAFVETPVPGNGGAPLVHDLEIDPGSGQPVLIFTDDASSFLRVLRCDGPGCTSALSHVHSVEQPPLVNQIGGASLELDSLGHPVIAYQDTGSLNLRILRCDDPLCHQATAPVATNVSMQTTANTCFADAIVPVTVDVADDDGDMIRVDVTLASLNASSNLAAFANLTPGPTIDTVSIDVVFPQGSGGSWFISEVEVHDATGLSTMSSWGTVIQLPVCLPTCNSNDALACAQFIVSSPLPQSAAGTSVGSTVDGIEVGSACATGTLGGSVWYQWTPAFTGTVTIDTIGSDYDTVLDVSASTGDPYAHSECNDDAPLSKQSSLQSNVDLGVPVFIRVSGFASGVEGAVVVNISSPLADSDGDGVLDGVDNCLLVWNPLQTDVDNDGVGNACDTPKGVTISPGPSWEGIPISYIGCPGGTVQMKIGTFTFVLSEVTPAGTYQYLLQAQDVPSGTYTVMFTVSCPDGSTVDETFTTTLQYLDPSGLILDQLDRPIEGATVTLLYSDVALTDPKDPGFTIVPDGSTIMSPANRMNPMPSRSDGFYRWDTIEGWFVVSVTAPKCVNPDGSGPEVRSAVLPVPPEQFNIDLVLECELAMCNGLVADIVAEPGVPVVGTDADEVILGTSGDDLIDAGGGNDVVCAGEGNDVVLAGDGDDIVFGGPGNDILRGNPGSDHLDGEAGNDRVLGGIGDDRLIGGVGDDYLGGFGGSDDISGGPGADTIFGGFGADTIDGGGGADTIYGLIGNDVINGGGGADLLNGDAGMDTIDGGDGDDVINGGNGPDTLAGGRGDDIVSGGKADDALSGGLGVDTCIGNKHHVGDTADASCETKFGVP